MNSIPLFSLRKRIGTLACFVACLSGFGFSALAQPSPDVAPQPSSVKTEKATDSAKSQPPGDAQRHGQWLEQLGLKPEQAEKVKAIMAQGHAESSALKQQLFAKRKALMQYLHSDAANEAKARTLNSDINDLQRKLSEVRLKTWFAMRSQLTQPQLQKLRELKEKMRGGEKDAAFSDGAGCAKMARPCGRTGDNSLNEAY